MFTGGQGATNTGFIFIALKPLNERKIGAPQIINRLRPQIEQTACCFGVYASLARFAYRWTQLQCAYQYTIQSDTVTDLQTWGPKLLAEMKHLPGLQDVNTDQQNGGLDEFYSITIE